LYNIFIVFDVYVANGYDSENTTMKIWPETNKNVYSERLLDNRNYCLELYGAITNGNEADSVVEILIPAETKQT